LSGRGAVVVGGTRGIGLAVATLLADLGAGVVVNGRDAHAATEAATSIDGAVAHPGSPADPAIADALIDRCTSEFGRIDILVNCAAKPSGQSRPPTLGEITAEEFWDHMNTKVMGYLRTAREVAPYMIKQGSGRIVNVSGLGAKHVGTTIGSIRNVGVAALTKNLADELAPHGVQVVCVHPGLVRTEATPGVIAAQAKAQGVSETEIEKRMAGRNLLRKIVTAEEIADVVTFLASPRAIAINGDAIPAGGGTPGSIFY